MRVDGYQTGDRISGPHQQGSRQLLLLLGGRVSVDTRALLRLRLTVYGELSVGPVSKQPLPGRLQQAAGHLS